MRYARTLRVEHPTERCGFEGCEALATRTTDPWDVESCPGHAAAARRDANIIEGESLQSAEEWADTLRSVARSGL